MPRFYGVAYDDFFDLEVMILGPGDVTPELPTRPQLLVREGVITRDWQALMALYACNSHRDGRLLPSRWTHSGVVVYNLACHLKGVDLSEYAGRIMVCRCKLVVSRHPQFLQSMARLSLFQRPWEAPREL